MDCWEGKVSERKFLWSTFCCCDWKKNWTKATWKGNGLFRLTHSGHSPPLRKVRAGIMDPAAYWLSGSGSCSVSFLIQSKSTCPGMVSPHQWVGPFWIYRFISKVIPPQTWPQMDQSDLCSPLTDWDSFFPGCVKMIVKTNQGSG